MLARRHWAVVKSSGNPKFLRIFPAPVSNAVASLAVQTLGEDQGVSLQPPWAHQPRGSPSGRAGNSIGKGNRPLTEIFLFPIVVFLFSTFSPPQNTLKGKALFARIFSGRVSWRSCAAFAAQGFSDPSKALSSCLALAATAWCALTSFIFSVLPPHCQIGGKQFSSTCTSPFWAKLFLLPLARRDACRIMEGDGRGDVDFFFSVPGNQIWSDQSLLFSLSSSPPVFIFSVFI